jgi:hypothetical protein
MIYGAQDFILSRLVMRVPQSRKIFVLKSKACQFVNGSSKFGQKKIKCIPDEDEIGIILL